MENITLEEEKILESIRESLKNLDEKDLIEILKFMEHLKLKKDTSKSKGSIK